MLNYPLVTFFYFLITQLQLTFVYKLYFVKKMHNTVVRPNLSPCPYRAEPYCNYFSGAYRFNGSRFTVLYRFFPLKRDFSRKKRQIFPFFGSKKWTLLLQYKQRFPLLFLTANRTVAKTRPFSFFNFNREPYRTQIRSVYRFINGKNGKMEV